MVDSSTDKVLGQFVAQRIQKLFSKQRVDVDYHFISDKGISYARNFGLKKAQADLVAFVDDDEYVIQDWVKFCRQYFREHSQVIALSGPKVPSNRKNYWHQVWNAIESRKYTFTGKTKFVSAGNSVYRVPFLRKHHIVFDEKMGGIASEDSVFSQKLNVAGATMVFHQDFRVFHDVRSTLNEFAQQWFQYGKGTFHYQRLYYPFEGRNPAKRIVHIGENLATPLKGNYLSYWRNKLGWGYLVKDFMFTLGFMFSWITSKE